MSPLPNLDPPSGDVVYTTSLLAHPPTAVEYVTYAEALDSGELVEHGHKSSFACAKSASELLREVGLTALCRLSWLARQRDVMFREPFRYLELRGTFDLVHCHTFSVRWSGFPTPVVASNALPLAHLYEGARGWSRRRTRLASILDHGLARATDVHYIASDLKGCDGIVAFTETLKDWYLCQGSSPNSVSVAPCFPDLPPAVQPHPVRGRIGFVARDFHAKGGDTLLAAWPTIRRDCPHASLVIVGSELREAVLPAGVTSLGPVDRERLLREILPTVDVLAYSSHMDGLPLILLESLAFGIPIVVSDYFALPEIVGGQRRAGRVVPEGDTAALARAVVDLLDDTVRREASEAALERFATTYGPAPAGKALRIAYDRAVSHFEERSNH